MAVLFFFATNERVENEPITKIILCLCFCEMQIQKKANNVRANQQVLVEAIDGMGSVTNERIWRLG